MKPLRIASVIPSMYSGGIGPVCSYAAKAMAEMTEWDVSLVCLHDDPCSVDHDSDSAGFQRVNLGLEYDCARSFLNWLEMNPQDLILTSGVSHIEPAFPYIHKQVRHVVQIHDSGKRYRGTATNFAPYLDGVLCVAKHIEDLIQSELASAGFGGISRTVHNGATYPPAIHRPPRSLDSAIKLLFIGRIDPVKGVADIPEILRHLVEMKVPVTLDIVGREEAPGEEEWLKKRIASSGCADIVNWHGNVPHEKCYEFAASSDVFLMPSRREPFGMVTIETMAMGCVPIAYDCPSGNREIIESRACGLLVPLGDTFSVANEIRSLHQSPDFLVRLSEQAVIRARSMFCADLMADRMISFIKDVITHGDSFPSARIDGSPAPSGARSDVQFKGYRQLPLGIRQIIRRKVGANARLCHWLLSR